MITVEIVGLPKGRLKGLVHLPGRPELGLSASGQLLIESVCTGSARDGDHFLHSSFCGADNAPMF